MFVFVVGCSLHCGYIVFSVALRCVALRLVANGHLVGMVNKQGRPSMTLAGAAKSICV